MPKKERPKRARRRRKDDAEVARYERAQAIIKGRSQDRDIDPGLIGNRASVERLVAAGPDADPAEHAMLRGWRRGFVGETVLDVLRDAISTGAEDVGAHAERTDA